MAKLISIHDRSVKYVLVFASLLFGLAIVLIPNFIFLWLGGQYPYTVKTFQILAVGWFFSLIATPAFVMIGGSGRPKYLIKSQLILVLSTVVLGILLGLRTGYIGIIIAMAISLIVTSLYLILTFAHITEGGINILSIKQCAISIMIAVVISILILLTASYIPHQDYITLAFKVIFGSIGYFGLIYFFRIITKSDLVEINLLRNQ